MHGRIHDFLIRPCDEVREFLADYLESALPLHRAIQFRIHLRLCERCRAYLEKYDTSIRLARGALVEPPPEELVELTLNFLHENAPGTRAPDEHTG